MATENKQTENYDITDVNARIIVDFKRAVMVVSLLANLTLFVSWAVVIAS
jgi:hypothetical protein